MSRNRVGLPCWTARSVVEAEAGAFARWNLATATASGGRGVTGVLLLVATPIGNLSELSPRAIEALASADVIACEDTRRTGRLLEHAGVAKPRLLVVNDHTESAATRTVLDVLDAGQTVVVVTDAGMPGISDPGERLVRAAVSAGHRVSVVAGPSAAIAALVVSGLPTGRFVFEGFLPRKGSGRTARLAALAAEPQDDRPLRGAASGRRDDRRPRDLPRRRSPRRHGPRADQAARGGVARLARRRRRSPRGGAAARRVRARRRRRAGSSACARGRHRGGVAVVPGRGSRSQDRGCGGRSRARRLEAAGL